ncbi:unnamed protein product [Symbiodinium natans]|uniref:Uncharacterized protein n=1 Tax=Symbiodinium natans TaxID=878477 RepID=A0A812NUD7_9DINO|nr:unnamed protein product [Symbiodinium natans]CAE7463046.1 unnamed protein product [Symbiodinium natans]
MAKGHKRTIPRLSILADVLQSYTKIRKAVQAARAAKQRWEQLEETLLNICTGQDTVVMGEICTRLQQKKRVQQPWANVSKKDDKLFKLLSSSAKIKNKSDSDGVSNFIRESFRCRAICVTSSRFRTKGNLPTGPVPRKTLPYRVYGYSSGQVCLAKHKRWCSEYRAWKALPKLTPYKRRLTDRMLQERCSVGAFVRLQILTDVCHRLGCAWVDLPTSSLGTGVHFGGGVMGTDEIAKVRNILKGRRQFRRLWGSSISLPEVGHLICEARQHVWKNKRKASMMEFVDEFNLQSTTPKKHRFHRLSRKRGFCSIIAKYACQK